MYYVMFGITVYRTDLCVYSFGAECHYLALFSDFTISDLFHHDYHHCYSDVFSPIAKPFEPRI